MRYLKIVVFLSILLPCKTAYCQFDKVKGTWVSSASDVIIIADIDSDTDNLNTISTLTESEDMMLRIVSDTLCFRSEYFYLGDHFKKTHTDRYDMLIAESAESRLLLKPVSSKSKEFFNNRGEIEFIRAEYNIDKTISLEKLIYHTTECYGRCPVIDLELDKNKAIYIQGEFFQGSHATIDSLRSGIFKGMLPDSLYNELIFILQTSNLRTLTFPEVHGADAPESTLIIYYNGQRKYLKSMFPPTIARRLISFLYSLSKNIILERTTEKKQLEK